MLHWLLKKFSGAPDRDTRKHPKCFKTKHSRTRRPPEMRLEHSTRAPEGHPKCFKTKHSRTRRPPEVLYIITLPHLEAARNPLEQSSRAPEGHPSCFKTKHLRTRRPPEVLRSKAVAHLEATRNLLGLEKTFVTPIGRLSALMPMYLVGKSFRYAGRAPQRSDAHVLGLEKTFVTPVGHQTFEIQEDTHMAEFNELS